MTPTHVATSGAHRILSTAQPQVQACKHHTPRPGKREIVKTRNVVFGRVEHIPGAAVEHNKFCVSVHFRNCSPESYEHVVTAVKETLNDHSDLRASRGRKVLEIQPQVCLHPCLGPPNPPPSPLMLCYYTLCFAGNCFVPSQQLKTQFDRCHAAAGISLHGPGACCM